MFTLQNSGDMVQKKKKEEEEKEEKEKEKEKGRRPWVVVRELRSTVLQREQWSLHCSRCRTVETW
jgi:hypothetical protein